MANDGDGKEERRRSLKGCFASSHPTQCLPSHPSPRSPPAPGCTHAAAKVGQPHLCVRVAALSSLAFSDSACLGAAAHLGETETIDASSGLTASVQRATQTTCVPVKRAASRISCHPNGYR